jgi:Xaa-Pro aminopeptidase
MKSRRALVILQAAFLLGLSGPGASSSPSWGPAPAGGEGTTYGDTWGQDTVAEIDPASVEETRRRRRRLVEILREDLPEGRRGAFYLKGAVDDGLNEFRQGSNFLYLTGIRQPGASLVLLFDGDSWEERLYLPQRDPELERFTGTTLGPGGVDPATGRPDDERRETLEVTGFGGAAGTGSVLEDLRGFLGRKDVLFLPSVSGKSDKPALAEGSIPRKLTDRRRGVKIQSAWGALARLRMVKSPGEIGRIRRAVEITCQAQEEAMKAMRPGLKEYEIEGLVEYVFTRSGARFPSFPTIVGSGPNSCILHYSSNSRTIGDGDLVVIDAGAEYERYAADVTRTLPASGRYGPEQRTIYEAVLRAQREGMVLARPGSSMRKIHERVKAVLEEDGLVEHLLHGCCHFVGLDVHDIGTMDETLEAGMVITVEPGVYIPEREIGIRIEDTVLITADGHEVLSACVPSDPREVERSILGD